MANHVTLPTKESENANEWFRFWFAANLAKRNISQKRLAIHLGLERKTIIAYLDGSRVPKLDVLAKMFNYFGYSEIRLPIKKEVPHDTVS